MSDEQTTATVAEQSAPAEAAPVDPIQEWLAKASPDEIMKHSRIQGIFGSRLQQEREKIQRDLSSEADQKARRDEHEAMLRLAREDPLTFSERFLSKDEQDKVAENLANLKRGAREDMAKTLGNAYKAIPEFSNLSSSDLERLTLAVQGKSDEEQIAAFNATALDIIAEKRATDRQAKFRETDLAKEREAIRQEEAAKRLRNGARPSLSRAGAPPTGNGWQDLPPGPEFDKQYEINVLGKRR